MVRINLIEHIIKLKKSGIKKTIDSRIKEFKQIGEEPSCVCFNELCFCILTANYSAEGGIRIQEKMKDGFLTLKQDDLAKRLKELGHRFPNTRADYIIISRKYKNSLKEMILSFDNEHDVREWLVENIKGIGYKESSHFMRNIGFEDVAIIDFHIIDLLAREKLIERPKTKSLTRNRYLEIEEILRKLAKKVKLNLAELDLYLWYIETGKILK
ncbi:MAG: N-glycosylase/DNA lyase [Candidatus Woesearchaeota archaeon]|nr:N-glycosylase/DNA lyase [Candidatus Woesearchaeota archaeon]